MYLNCNTRPWELLLVINSHLPRDSIVGMCRVEMDKDGYCIVYRSWYRGVHARTVSCRLCFKEGTSSVLYLGEYDFAVLLEHMAAVYRH